MPTPRPGRTTALTPLLLLILLVPACAPAATPEPVLQPALVLSGAATQLRTVEVTRQVTVEVTRLVDMPVTLTPSATPDWTATPTPTATRTRIPSATPTWAAPKVSIREHSACLYGPGWAYLYKYGLNATVWMWVIGRNSEGTWLFVKALYDPDWNGCWIETDRVDFLSGSVSDVPVYWMGLPGSLPAYGPPTSVTATRSGNEVTVYWETVWMTEDDYRGYLIEAWVCQGGRQVFLPIGAPAPLPMPSVWENVGTFSAKIIDEPGCTLPSSARIYSVEKHGYTWYRMIPWPPYETTPAPTPTP